MLKKTCELVYYIAIALAFFFTYQYITYEISIVYLKSIKEPLLLINST